LTSWQALKERARLKPGQKVFIPAGSGGIGTFAIQLAKYLGAKVATTTSTANVDLVRSLGADEVIDYKKERFESRVSGIDLVYDLIGDDTQERSWAVLKKGGTLVSTVQEPSKEKAQAIGVRAMRYTAASNASQLGEIDALIQAGKVRPLVARTWAYGNAKEALRALEEGHGTGKLVLDMAGVIASLPDPVYKPGD
jgi:NADPH:quinone reductase-like Zn-dependent oxidoreductase